MTKKYAIIVAGGSGSRMQSEIPKQFIELEGTPILMLTIKQFQKAYPDIEVILVLPADQFSFWGKLKQQYSFTLPHRTVAGGASRFQSVKNGLNAIHSQEGVVAIHDGVRPFISPKIIRHSFEVAQSNKNAVTSMPLKDSIRHVDDSGNNQAKPRKDYRIIQTPQTFQLSLLKEAFETEELDIFTDDATVFEHAGHPINLIDGDYRNIKITTPEDLEVGKVLLRQFE